MRRFRGCGTQIVIRCLVALVTATASSITFARESSIVSRPRVVFVLPADTRADVESSVREAIEAQFAGSGADVEFEHFQGPTSDLRKQVDTARKLAAQIGARGVFWLDASEDGDWLLYLCEPEGDRVLVRRLPRSKSTAATVEAVSVIARVSTSALIAGSRIGMQPVSEPPSVDRPAPAGEPATNRSAPVDPRDMRNGSRADSAAVERLRHIRLHAGYRGNSFAPQVGFRHGAALGGTWFATGTGGWFAGIELATFPETNVRQGANSFAVGRLPLGASGGWRFPTPWVDVNILGVYTAEITTRRSTGNSEGVATPSSTRLLSLVGARIRVERKVGPVLSLYAQAGTDLVLNKFQYVAQEGAQERELLDPNRVRAVLDAGISIWP